MQFALDHDGYVSVAEAKRFGLAQTYLVQGEQEGQFDKVAKGLYLRKGYPLDPHYILHFRYPKAVFHLKSAAFLHHWIDSDDEIMDVKLPRNYMTKGIEGAKCKHVANLDYQTGIGLALTPCGQFVSVTDKERTLLDLILHYECFDDEEWKKMISVGFTDDIDFMRLERYAEQFRAQQKIALLRKILG